jgi:hypothetical protein
MKMLLRIAVAIGVVIAIGLAGLHAFGQRQLQAKEEPRDQSVNVHHADLDNRADLVGVELGFMRGATNFNDPGYRDLPNPAQMQISPAP